MSAQRLALAGVLLAGCAHGTSTRVGDGAEVGVGRVAADVERIRGLPRLRALSASVLDPAQFKAALEARSRLDDREIAKERSVWVAFGFVQAGFDLGAAIRSVVGEQVMAFYDHKKRVLFLPKKLGQSAAESDWIVAHEIEHALQDQHFGLDRKIVGEDRRLAWASLVEGDAMMVMTGIIAERSKLALATAFARLGSFVRSMPPDALVQMSGHSPAISSAPAILREGLIFPYLGALDLLSGVHRAGSFALVDKMFARPPASTEQVLHPEKYVAGEEPVRVVDPLLPAGVRRVQTETLGELRTRVLFSECLSFQRAKQVAEGWGGDRYTVGERQDGSLLLLWSTAWDDEAHALDFDAALVAYQRCWKPSPAGAKPSITTEASIVREGKRVVFVRGLPPAEAESLARAMLRQPIAVAPRTPPLPITTLPAPAQEAAGELPIARRPAQLVDGHFVSPMLGIEVELPRGAEGKVVAASGMLTFSRKTPTVVGGALLYLPSAPTAELRERIYASTLAGARSTLPGGTRFNVVGEGEVDLRWARGWHRTWALDGGRGMRMYLLGYCEDKALVAVTIAWSDLATQVELDQWARSIARASGKPPICE